MDYGSRWAEPQAALPPHLHDLYYAPLRPHPDLIHNHQQHLHVLHSSSSSSSAAAAYHYPNPNPNPNRCPTPTHDAHLPSIAIAGALRPPATDNYPPNPYASHVGYQELHAVPYSYPAAVPPAAAAAAVGAPSSYYYGGGGEDPHSLAVKEAIRQYGVDPHRFEPVLTSSSNGLEPTDPSQVRNPHLHGRASRLTSKKAMKKGSKGATKIMQSVYCEVCKIECNTREVLKTHKQGKKHKKKLQKLQDSITAKPTKAPTTRVETKETPDADKSKAGGEKTKKKGAPATAEELEVKKKRVLEGGAAAEGVKVCTICNVVVNSQKVFEYHVAGHKHTAMVKKLQEEH